MMTGHNKLEWDPEAEQRLKKAPFFIRRFARSKLEKEAVKRGLNRVTVELLEQVKKKEMN